MTKIVKAGLVLLVTILLVTGTPSVTYACEGSPGTCPCTGC